MIKLDYNRFETRMTRIAERILGNHMAEIVKSNQRFLALKHKSGHHFHQLDMERQKKCLVQTADILAKLHIPVKHLDPLLDPGVDSFFMANYSPLTQDEIIRVWERNSQQSGTDLAQKADTIIKDFCKKPYDGNAERTLIHGDLHIDNILYFPENDSVYLLDWEDLRIGFPEEDLAFICAGLPDELHTCLLESYQHTGRTVSVNIFQHYLSQRRAHSTLRRLFNEHLKALPL